MGAQKLEPVPIPKAKHRDPAWHTLAGSAVCVGAAYLTSEYGVWIWTWAFILSTASTIISAYGFACFPIWRLFDRNVGDPLWVKLVSAAAGIAAMYYMQNFIGHYYTFIRAVLALT